MPMPEKKKVTLINNLGLEKEEEINLNLFTPDKTAEYIVDLSLPLEVRIKYMEEYYKQFGTGETIELVNRLSSMYQMSGTKILEKYMEEITQIKSKIPIFLKITAAKSLCYYKPDQIIGYQALNTICKHLDQVQDKKQLEDDEISTPVKIETICLLMLHPVYKQQSRDYFCTIINNIKLECLWRYKTILSLENKDIPEKIYFIKEAAFEFFTETNNQILYRILAGQLIIQKCSPTQEVTEIIETTLLFFAQDPKVDYNLRADSADVILKLGSPKNKIKAKEIIIILGLDTKGNSKNIFENAQNVHSDDIEESVIKGIEFLSTIDTKTITGIPGSPYITFEYVKKQITGILKKEKSKTQTREAIKISLNRIYLDRALYSKFNYTLINILLKVWTYTCSHDSSDEIKKRLIEELVEMSGTCSSGFAGRLVNVISGFGDSGLQISWRDQIISNFIGRLNAKARDITDLQNIYRNSKLYEIKTTYRPGTRNIDLDLDLDLNKNLDAKELDKGKDLNLDAKELDKDLDSKELFDFQEKVLEEMTITSNDYQAKKNFLLFFRKNMLVIREELYIEFKPYITDTDFDLFFRSAISCYETGDYI